MAAGRATTVGALDTRVSDFRDEVTRQFEALNRRLDGLSVVHVDAYEADKRTAATELEAVKGDVAALKDRNRRLQNWLVGLGITIVGGLLSNIGVLVAHVK